MPLLKKSALFFSSFCRIKLKPKLKQLIDDLLHPANHPKNTALSMAIGVFIAIWIPIGFQLGAMLLLLTVINYNFAIATIVSFISNPLTVLPIYYFAIKIGEWLLQTNFAWKFFSDFIDHPAWEELIKFGSDNLVIFFSGITFLAVISSLLTYTFALKFTVYLRSKNHVC